MTACPKCGDCDLLGLIQPLWVGLDTNGAPDYSTVSLPSDAEVGSQRQCMGCSFEWDLKDYPPQ